MIRTCLGPVFVMAALGACDDRAPIEPATPPITLPRATPPAALHDAGVVVVTAKELVEATGDGGVLEDVTRAAQGAGFGEVDFAIRPPPAAE